METEILTSTRELDFSVLALYWRATFTVKLVMLLLLLGSFWSWALIFQKLFVFRDKKQKFEHFEKTFFTSTSLDELYEHTSRKKTPVAIEGIFVTGLQEWRNSFRADGSFVNNWQQRVQRVMDLSISKESERLNIGLSFLATVGAVAPFIGLFGTVWGIKNSFEEISIAQSTDLSVVAPGIAEALLATGLGLFTAIPAVIFYNKLLHDSDYLVGKMEHFMEELMLILVREMG